MIGTSEGKIYESEFHYQLGIPMAEPDFDGQPDGPDMDAARRKKIREDLNKDIDILTPSAPPPERGNELASSDGNIIPPITTAESDLYIDETGRQKSKANDAVIEQNFEDYYRERANTLTDAESNALSRYQGDGPGKFTKEDEVLIKPLLEELKERTKSLPSSKEENGEIRFFNWPGLLMDQLLKEHRSRKVSDNEFMGDDAEVSAQAREKTFSGSVLPFSRDKDGNVFFDSDAGVVGSLKKAFTYPLRVAQGEVDPLSPEGAEENFNFITSFMTGGLATAAGRPGTAGIFGGTLGGVRDSNTLLRMLRAQDLEDEGKMVKDIYDETGLWKGPDGKWRHEISDFPSEINTQALKDVTPQEDTDGIAGWTKMFTSTGKQYEIPEGAKLEDVLHHPELFKMYPELKKIKFTNDFTGETPMTQGYFDKKEGKIAIRGPVTEDRLLSILMHEIQHSVQDIEGFIPGSNTKTWLPPDDYKVATQVKDSARKTADHLWNSEVEKSLPKSELGQKYLKAGNTEQDVIDHVWETGWRGLNKLAKDPNNYKTNLTEEELSAVIHLHENHPKFFSSNLRNIKAQELVEGMEKEAFDNYWKFYGEAEARTVQERLRMMAYQRQKTPMWKSETMKKTYPEGFMRNENLDHSYAPAVKALRKRKK